MDRMCMENAMDNERVVEWIMMFDNEPLFFSARRYLVFNRDDDPVKKDTDGNQGEDEDSDDGEEQLCKHRQRGDEDHAPCGPQEQGPFQE
ncbi:hypothetical protein BpHYR1_032106 [Brachionus plicatilis]|uniref:Uncharacterized protein n=1 Tax=Brachionus plicatilis TaxID=10195 RepID=A0A3M7RC62_BRAPC|nr:hypothetical protein BpHYR1_032106 [Brachionus plicatilis]